MQPSRRMLGTAAALAAALAYAAVPSESQTPDVAALAVDDECGDDATCSLNALQLRGQKAVAQDKEEQIPWWWYYHHAAPQYHPAPHPAPRPAYHPPPTYHRAPPPPSAPVVAATTAAPVVVETTTTEVLEPGMPGAPGIVPVAATTAAPVAATTAAPVAAATEAPATEAPVEAAPGAGEPGAPGIVPVAATTATPVAATEAPAAVTEAPADATEAPAVAAAPSTEPPTVQDKDDDDSEATAASDDVAASDDAPAAAEAGDAEAAEAPEAPAADTVVCGEAWGQCGGSGYEGATCCGAGTECQVVDMYYSQCMPAGMKPAPKVDEEKKAEEAKALQEQGPDGCLVKSYSQCGGAGYTGSTCCQGGFTCTTVDQYYAQCAPVTAETLGVKYEPAADLTQPSEAPLHTFYVYRATNAEDHPNENVDGASLGGVMWYLHNEVVWQTPRKFDIMRIKRIKVQTRATAPLYAKGLNFGVRQAFDDGQCTGPFNCDKAYEKFGYFVGCNDLGTFPYPDYEVNYTGTWYSFPGSCSSKKFQDQNATCKMDQPGGLCKGTPTGAGNCTYSYEDAGEVKVDEIEGIPNYDAFVAANLREYNKTADEGVGLTFWNGINDTVANKHRVARLDALFKKHYPHMPADADLPAPPCDFDFGVFFLGKTKAQADEAASAEAAKQDLGPAGRLGSTQ